MLASFPKVPKTLRPKALKIDVFDYSIVVWRPLSREPPRIFAQTLHFQSLESLGYIVVADSMGLSSFKFSYVLKQSVKWPFKVIQGRWFWHQSKAGMQQVIKSNLGPILLHFRDTARFLVRAVASPLFDQNFVCVYLGLDCWCCWGSCRSESPRLIIRVHVIISEVTVYSRMDGQTDDLL